MVYFHGGAYSTGSVTDPINDGSRLATRGDVVVVTVNHRLGALGYLYLARLDPRFPDSGNAGQLDLIVALQWIQRNIAARSEEHTSELQSLMRISYAVFCLKKKKSTQNI